LIPESNPKFASNARYAEKNLKAAGNKRRCGTVLNVAASVAFKTGFEGMITYDH
jgi:hypothetical protein